MRIKELKRIVDKRDITFDYKGSAGSVLSVESSNISLEKKEIVEAQTISLTNITLSGNQTINGHTTVDGTTVLVNGQTDPKDNGIYYANSSTWSRVPNDLNDVKLVKIVGGDYNTQFYTLQNEPIEIDTDNINYVKIYEDGAIPILSTSFSFDESDIIASISSLQTIIPAISGYDISVISLNVSYTSTSFNITGPAYLTYTNGTNYTYTISDAFWGGTGSSRAEIKKYTGANINAFTSGDSWGLYSPSLIYTSGTINGTIYLTYRYIAV